MVRAVLAAQGGGGNLHNIRQVFLLFWLMGVGCVYLGCRAQYSPIYTWELCGSTEDVGL